MMAVDLPNGDLLIPIRAESEGVIGDSMLQITDRHPDYKVWIEFIRKNKESK